MLLWLLVKGVPFLSKEETEASDFTAYCHFFYDLDQNLQRQIPVLRTPPARQSRCYCFLVRDIFFVILRFIFWTPWNSCSISESRRGCGEGYQVVSPPPSSSRGFLWASLFLGQRFSAFQDMMSGPSYSKEVRGFYWEGQTKPLICIGISEADAKPVSPFVTQWADYVMCMCRVWALSGSCSLVRISFHTRVAA